MIRHFLDCSSGHLSPDTIAQRSHGVMSAKLTGAWLDDRLADDGLRDPRNLTAPAISFGARVARLRCTPSAGIG